MHLDDLPKVQSPRAQVEAAISTLIQQLQPGDQLPPEPALAQQLGVSRPTLREALRTFAERGLLVRRPGIGTFVTSRLPILETGLEVLESLERMAQRLGLATEMMHLTVAERQATDMELTGLNLTAPTQVLIVGRVISIAKEPVADLRDVVPVDILRAEDLSADFRGSVLDILLSRGAPVLTTSRTQIKAVAADQPQAQRLAVEPGTALLQLVAQLFSYDERVVDYSVSTFVPGHFKFHVMRQVRNA